MLDFDPSLMQNLAQAFLWTYCQATVSHTLGMSDHHDVYLMQDSTSFM